MIFIKTQSAIKLIITKFSNLENILHMTITTARKKTIFDDTEFLVIIE